MTGATVLVVVAALAFAASQKRTPPRKGGGAPPAPPRTPPRAYPPTPDTSTWKEGFFGQQWSLPALRQLARDAGFSPSGSPSDIDIAAAIAMAESRGFVGALGDKRFGWSVGLWQVNLPAHRQYDAEALRTDAAYNANAALEIAQTSRALRGNPWLPWSTYTQAPYPYRRYLPGGA